MSLRHLKAASRFLAHRFRELHPFDIEASLLNACNLRCVYCKCPEIKTTLLTTEQWRTIIHGLRALGAIRIKFVGGEPTLRQDFRELCAEAQRAGIITAVTTNGLPVADQPALLDYLDEVVFSLDAVDPAIHDRHRSEGTHAQVVRAIDIALGRGLPTYVNMVVSRENLGEIEAMLEFCEARGVWLHVQPVYFYWMYADATARPLELTPEEVQTMHRRLATWKRQGRRLIFSAQAYEQAATWPDYAVSTTRTVGESSCMAGEFYVHIEPNGDVHPCGYNGDGLRPKNIITDGLEEALRHVQRHHCGDCWTVSLSERKAVFGLQPSALREVVRRWIVSKESARD